MTQFRDELPIISAKAGPLRGQQWTVRTQLLVGRDPSCDIVISDRRISRVHARFYLSSGGTFIEDMGSKNGTHVNGDRIIKPVNLQDGDTVQIAYTQEFAFLSSDATVILEFIPETLTPTTIENTSIKIESHARIVWIHGKEVDPPLSASQFKLLELLFTRRGKVVSRDSLIKAIWGKEQAVVISQQALEALVRRLRERLKSYDLEHEYIITIRGHGLRLDL